jgi:restriction system protein
MTTSSYRAWEREQKQRYLEQQQAHAERLNEEIDRRLTDLDRILATGLSRTLKVDFEAMRINSPLLTMRDLDIPAPTPQLGDFLPKPPNALAKLLPGASQRYAQREQEGRRAYEEAVATWKKQEAARQAEVERIQEQHKRVEELVADWRVGKRAAVEECLRKILSDGSYPVGFPRAFSLRYLSSRHELLLEQQLPLAREVIPPEASWRYVKARDVVEARPRSMADIDRRYKTVLAQLVLRTVYEVFTVNEHNRVETVAYNGFVLDIDPTTGRLSKRILASLRTSREEFLDRNFYHIDPERTLKALRANFSPAPRELQAVQPILEFDVDDPRFIQEEDIISTLDERTNLIDLTPSAFEQLITNLFNAMGFDAYATKTSKDGGVDCIAYFKQAVVGGKYVIQAKRWTNNVQVDAVRDLFGAMDHERANTGILIATSRFAPACYKFAEGKPMQLIDGGNLVALIEQYTKLKVKIVIPPRGSQPSNS